MIAAVKGGNVTVALQTETADKRMSHSFETGGKKGVFFGTGGHIQTRFSRDQQNGGQVNREKREGGVFIHQRIVGTVVFSQISFDSEVSRHLAADKKQTGKGFVAQVIRSKKSRRFLITQRPCISGIQMKL